MSAYLDKPRRSLAQVRSDLAKEHLDTLLAWVRGKLPDHERERRCAALSRRIEMIDAEMIDAG